MPLDSGTLTAWRGANTAEAGKMPALKYTQIWGSYYEDRTVGIQRYYTAMQHDSRVDAMVRVQRTYELQPASDRIVLSPYSHEDGSAYRIIQLQQVLDDDGLPVTDLTLERDDGIDAGQLQTGAGGAY